MTDDEPFGSRLISGLIEEMNRTQEQYIYDFFGSAERFIALSGIYVLEEHPVDIFIAEDSWDDDEFNEATVSITQQIRIRLKTPEELAMETKQLTEADKDLVMRMWPKTKSNIH